MLLCVFLTSGGRTLAEVEVEVVLEEEVALPGAGIEVDEAVVVEAEGESVDEVIGLAEDAVEAATNSTPGDNKVLKFEFKCMLCHWGAEVLVEYAREGKSVDGFLSFTSTICHLMGIETKVSLKISAEPNLSTKWQNSSFIELCSVCIPWDK